MKIPNKEESAMQNSSKRFLVIASVVFVGACLLYSDLYAQATGQSSRESSNSFTSLAWFPGIPGKSGPIANSSSVLIRNANGVAYTTSTTGLLAGGAYTVWWVIFNNPEFCSPPGCAAKDFPPNGDPRVQASVLWASGRVVDGRGQGNFSSHLAARGVSAAPGQILFGPALLDAFGAEIHLVVRSHGPASMNPVVLNAQLTTFGGNCSIIPNPCQDQQAAQHFPGEDQKD